ncbi:MAG: ATP-dependent Clp protease ATP-binding subunit [Firmicutes bacterium]|nr:ATP-dependent Clp protease ATP-binding subunit [Bacillota bacterium]
MVLCSRCHKRIPVIFKKQFINGKSEVEALCIRCARETGMSEIDDIIKNAGLSEEDIEQMDVEISPEEAAELDTSLIAGVGGGEDGKTPPVDLSKIFGKIMPSGIMPQGVMNSQNQNSNVENGHGNKKQSKPTKKFLEMYCLDLTRKAKDGKIDRIVGRDREISRVIQILCRRQKNNPCLIGEPGVGKTAVAEALAQRIVDGNVPFKLKNYEVYMVDMTAIVAGTQFRGQFEVRMKGLIDEVKALGNIILVIDEIHSIASAGDSEGSMNAANILKPALSRGEIQVIGATTLTEYRKYIEKDAALERRFQPVLIDEPSVEESVCVLRGIKKYYEQFHRIKVSDEIIERIVTLSERYITDRFLPDKAIDLLDEAASYKALNSAAMIKRDEVESEYKKITTEREKLETEVQTADGDDASEDRYKKIADLRVTELQKKDELDKLSTECSGIELTLDDVAQVIEIWTGIPASNITENEFKRIDRLEANIKSRIIGQDEAVETVVRAIKRSRAGVAYKRKPVSFIFAGPTGVGKTELVKVLASELFDSPETLIRLDMSEFMEKHSVSRIIGAPPGYVGYDDAGQLTEKIRRKPYSVVLFDEIEKAHPDVLNILLQILDDGRVTDAHGKTVSFEDTVIIMTTNAGSNLNMAMAGFGGSVTQNNSEKTNKALSEFLRPEFINRVDEVVLFRALEKDDFIKIASLMLNDLSKALIQKNIKFVYSPEAAEYIAEHSYSHKYGARNMRRYIQREVEDEAARQIIDSYESPICAISLDVNEGKLRITSV